MCAECERMDVDNAPHPYEHIRLEREALDSAAYRSAVLRAALHLVRRNTGMTLREISRRTGLKHSSIYRWSSGEGGCPTLSLEGAIARLELVLRDPAAAA